MFLDVFKKEKFKQYSKISKIIILVVPISKNASLFERYFSVFCLKKKIWKKFNRQSCNSHSNHIFTIMVSKLSLSITITIAMVLSFFKVNLV